MIDSLGSRIRKLRKARGWRQEDLAAHTSVGRSQIVNIESGRYNPSIDALQEIAAALEVPIDDLLDEDTVLAEIHHRTPSEANPSEYILTLRLRVRIEDNRIRSFVVEDAVANKVVKRR